jgi:hypothetical protein
MAWGSDASGGSDRNEALTFQGSVRGDTINSIFGERGSCGLVGHLSDLGWFAWIGPNFAEPRSRIKYECPGTWHASIVAVQAYE